MSAIITRWNRLSNIERVLAIIAMPVVIPAVLVIGTVVFAFVAVNTAYDLLIGDNDF